MKQKYWVAILVFIYFFTRLWHLELTLPFVFDEATDLYRMKEIWDQKKLTLVGPISTDNKKVFSSLPYYMYLPFAVAGNFDIASPAWGAVFWGGLTTWILYLIAKRINRKLIRWMMVLALMWTPLIITQRHAYNPNTIPFWVALGIYFHLKKGIRAAIISGIAFGFAVHAHYLAGVAGGVFLLINSIAAGFNKQWLKASLPWLGFGLALAPLLLFDLVHYPGIFILKGILYPQMSEVGFQINRLIPALLSGINQTLTFISGGATLGLGLGAGLILLMILDRFKTVKWFIPFLMQTAVGVMTSNNYELRYTYAGLVFLLVILILPRKKGAAKLAKSLMLIILVGSALNLKQVLTEPTTYPPVIVVRAAGQIMKSICTDPNLKNPNITALMSPDGDQLANKYRWYPPLQGCHFRAPSEYDASENLFVITTALSESILRQDSSATIIPFKHARLREVYPLALEPWSLYWFSY